MFMYENSGPNLFPDDVHREETNSNQYCHCSFLILKEEKKKNQSFFLPIHGKEINVHSHQRIVPVEGGTSFLPAHPAVH